MSDTFNQWAILELLGHVRITGKVSEELRFGVALGRIDIPTGDGFTTQYFGGSSIYRLTPTTEEIARSVAMSNQPEPVHRWELPAPTKADIPAEAPYSDDLPYDEDRDDGRYDDE